MLNAFLQLDSQATQFINALIPHNQLLDLLFSFFSLRGMSVIVWVIILVLHIIFEEKINKKFIFYFVFSIAIASIVVFGMKELIQRPRPTEFCANDFSFPSGHAANAFAASSILAFFDKKRRWLYYIVAATISFSRIYLGCHYFLDVIGGGVIGYLISSLILRLKTFPYTSPSHRKS